MASLSIYDDDRSATPDFFHKQISDPLEFSAAYGETKASVKAKHLVDHDLNNYREGLWSFTGEEKFCIPEKVSVDDKIGISHHGATTPPLKRWYWQNNSDGMRQKVLLSWNQRLEQAPSHEQVHDGYKVWNVSAAGQEVKAMNSYPYASTTPVHVASCQPTADTRDAVNEENIFTPPPPTFSDPHDWASRSSSLSANEIISEDNRKSMARKQYYDRSGLLWECASVLLEKTSLHPTNLTEYEFVKLVCLQGYEIFQWLATNRSYLVDRAEGQWHQANSLLMNNGGLDGLNTNFIDDFLWMEVGDQVSFIKSYKRLQLEAMALREGVRLPKTELDALCTMHDEDKLATILIYKNEAVQASLQMLDSFNCNETFYETKRGASTKADNLHLKFLKGLGSQKHEIFHGSDGLPHLAYRAKAGMGPLAAADDSRYVSDAMREVQKHIVRSRGNSEASNNTSEASGTDKSGKASSIFDGSKSQGLSKCDSASEHLDHDMIHRLDAKTTSVINISPRTSNFSEVETLVGGTEDLPHLQRHKISYYDLRGLASTIQLKGHISSYDENCCDEGSDWDFSPSKSLRKKASKLFDAFKKPFTFSSRKGNRHTVKEYFN